MTENYIDETLTYISSKFHRIFDFLLYFEFKETNTNDSEIYDKVAWFIYIYQIFHEFFKLSFSNGIVMVSTTPGPQ